MVWASRLRQAEVDPLTESELMLLAPLHRKYHVLYYNTTMKVFLLRGFNYPGRRCRGERSKRYRAHGSGVAYAIKKVGGHEIEQEAIKRCQEEGPFKPGQVYVTTGGSRWKYVIHAVTMMYPAEPADYDSAGEALAKPLRKPSI